MEVFSGIGGGLVALNKLKIAISKIVTCEMNPMAKAVCDYHHSSTHVKYKHISLFEELESELDKVMEEFGREFGTKLLIFI